MSTEASLTFNHWLAENIEVFCLDLLPYLSKKLNKLIEFDSSLSLETRVEKIVQGEIPFAWLCGLLYTKLKDEQNAPLEPLLSPILNGYQEAEYQSYVIVHKTSTNHSLADLQGKRIAINEEDSFSGHHIMRYCLKDRNFGFKLLKSGSHANSIQFVARRQADAASIDSSLYDYLAREKPERLKEVRILMPLKKFPMPPILVHTSIQPDLKEAITFLLLYMHEDSEGQSLLKDHAITKFVTVNDTNYDPIREAFHSGQNLEQQT